MNRHVTTQPQGMTMLELMFAIAILSIAMSATLACTQSSHLADTSAFDRSKGTDVAEQIMEECLSLSVTQALLVNGNALLTEGYAAKIVVTQRSSGLIEIETMVLRPTEDVTAEELSAMTSEEFWNMPSATSSRIRLVTLSAGSG